ncbi:MAG TPA: glycosyltransferase family 4 protein [Hyphomicrobiales bacterium]|nr:glycosyltransferase family 4 protein [Hyphomicrobiales bacterium]
MSDYRVLHLLPDLSVGGGQMMVLRLASALRQKRCAVIVAFCKSDRAMSAEYGRAGIPIFDLGMSTFTHIAKAERKLEKIARDNDVSMIHTHGTKYDKILGHILSRRLNIPEVTTLHGMPPIYKVERLSLRNLARVCWERAAFKLDWWLARNRLDGVTAVSQPVLEAWRPRLNQADYKRTRKEQVIHWGIEANEFPLLPVETISSIRQEIAGAAQTPSPLLVSVGRLHAGKNMRALPLAMKTVVARWPRALLCIVGDGDERKILDRMATDLGISANIRFLGERHDVPSLLAAADLSIFPSLIEGFGMVALESLAAGTPVICFDLPSLRTLRHDTGAFRIAHTTTPEALGATITGAIGDKQLSAEARRAQKIVFDMWTMDQTASAYDGFYRAILAKTQNLCV